MTDKEFFEALKEPTAPVNVGASVSGDAASAFTLSADDFDHEELAKVTPPEPEPTAANDTVTVPLDAGDTADIFIVVADSLQNPLFFALAKHKRIRKLFPEPGEYTEALDIQHLTDDELKEKYKDDYEKKRNLVARLKDLDRYLKEISRQLPFTHDEHERLHEPLEKICEKSGIGLPPGLALVLAAATVFAPRVTMLMAD